MIDVVILTTFTILEGIITKFTAGIEQNKEKSIAFEGVSGKITALISILHNMI